MFYLPPQVLIYPITDTDENDFENYPSLKDFAATPGLGDVTIRWFMSHSSAHMTKQELKSTICPMSWTDLELSRTPPTVVVHAELDMVRDIGLRYVDKLGGAGVDVESHMVEGVPHGFFTYVDTYKTKVKEAYDPVVKFIKQFHQ